MRTPVQQWGTVGGRRPPSWATGARRKPSPDQRLPCGAVAAPSQSARALNKHKSTFAVPLPSPLRPSCGLDDLLINGWSCPQGGCAGGLPQAAPRESPPGRAEVPHSILRSSREPGAFGSNSLHLLPALPQGQISRPRGARALVLICISAAEVGLTPRRCRFSLTFTS